MYIARNRARSTHAIPEPTITYVAMLTICIAENSFVFSILTKLSSKVRDWKIKYNKLVYPFMKIKISNIKTIKLF